MEVPQAGSQPAEMFAAQDIDTCLHVAHARVVAARGLILDSMVAAKEAGVQMLKMVDDIATELIGVYDKAFLATVEVHQRLWEKAMGLWGSLTP